MKQLIAVAAALALGCSSGGTGNSKKSDAGTTTGTTTGNTSGETVTGETATTGEPTTTGETATTGETTGSGATTGGETTEGETSGGETTEGGTGGTPGGGTPGGGTPGGGTPGGGTPGGGTTGGGGNADCATTLQCIQNCGQAGEACAQACLGSASAEAQTQLNAMLACLQTACPNSDQACIQAAAQNECGPQLDACLGGGGGTTGGGTTGGTTGGGGNGSCSAAFECLTACQDQACATACLNQMDQDSGVIWNALAQCIVDTCPDQDQACVQGALQGACGAEFAACTGDMKPGVDIDLGSMQMSFYMPMHFVLQKAMLLLPAN